MVFPYLAGELITQNFKWFIGRDFETARPVFDFIAVFEFYWSHTSHSNFNAKFCSEKYVSDLGSI